MKIKESHRCKFLSGISSEQRLAARPAGDMVAFSMYDVPVDILTGNLRRLRQDHVDAQPPAPVRHVINKHGVWWEVLRCPYCLRTHRHGADKIDPLTSLGTRLSHCYAGEYRLVAIEGIIRQHDLDEFFPIVASVEFIVQTYLVSGNHLDL